MPIKLHDTVRYEDEVYTVEKDYGNGVYFIGNDDDFVDLVPASQLTIVEIFSPITMGQFRALTADVPDNVRFEVYSGARASLVNFSVEARDNGVIVRAND